MTIHKYVHVACEWPGCSARVGDSVLQADTAAQIRAYAAALCWTRPGGLDLCGHHVDAADHVPALVDVNAGGHVSIWPWRVDCSCGFTPEKGTGEKDYAWRIWVRHLPREKHLVDSADNCEALLAAEKEILHAQLRINRAGRMEQMAALAAAGHDFGPAQGKQDRLICLWSCTRCGAKAVELGPDDGLYGLAMTRPCQP
jgi:hypothetical protein